MRIPFLCKIYRHSINRHRVWEDGLNFRTTCARCGAELIRDDSITRASSKWRKFDLLLDHDPRRKAHPRDRENKHS